MLLACLKSMSSACVRATWLREPSCGGTCRTEQMFAVKCAHHQGFSQSQLLPHPKLDVTSSHWLPNMASAYKAHSQRAIE